MKDRIEVFLTKIKLVHLYDAYCRPVLQAKGFIEEQEQEKGKMVRFKVVKELPSKEEYLKLRNETYSFSIESIYEGAKSEIEDLQSEMEDWANNLESTSLASTDKCSAVREAADSLSNLNWPELEVGWPDVKVLNLPELSNRTGRAHRAGCAASDLETVSQALHDYNEKFSELADTIKEAHESFADDCDDVINEIQSVDFPGMY